MRSFVFLPLALIATGYPTSGFALSEDECIGYATEAMNQVRKFNELKCGDKDPPGRWRFQTAHHYKWCRGLQPGDEHYAATESKARMDRLGSCEQKAAVVPPPAEGGITRFVGANPTDIYDRREGEKISTLPAGMQIKTVGNCGDEWCETTRGPWIWGGDLR